MMPENMQALTVARFLPNARCCHNFRRDSAHSGAVLNASKWPVLRNEDIFALGFWAFHLNIIINRVSE